MSLFSPKPAGSMDLIVGLESASAHASLVVFAEGEHPRVLFTYESAITWKKNVDSALVTKAAFKAVKECLEAAKRFKHIRSSELPRRIGKIHFILSSPWIVPEARTVSVKLDENTVVTENHVLDVIRNEEKKDTGERDIVVIEQKIFDVRLNGYSISDWRGKTARELEVSFTASLAGQRTVDRLREISAEILGNCTIAFHSAILLGRIGLAEAGIKDHDYAFIHVQGEMTEIFVLNRSVFSVLGSFPMGSRTIVRMYSEAQSVSEPIADSTITLYTAEHLDPDHGKASVKNIEDLANHWVGEIRGIAGLPSGPGGAGDLPRSIIITASSHDEFFARTIRQSFPKSKVETLAIDSIMPLVRYEEGAERKRLVGIFALALNTLDRT